MAKGDGSGIDPRIAVTHWSTDDTPPDRRFAVWSARPWPSLAPLFEIEPLEPFETRSAHIVVGGMVVQFGDGTARRYHRSKKRAEADGVDMLGVSILANGEIKGRAGPRPFAAGRHGILLLDLTRPARFVFGRSTSVQLAVPRALAARHLGPLDDLHGLAVPAPHSMLLMRHLLAVRKALPVLTIAQGPLLAGVILDLLAIAIGRGGETAAVSSAAQASPSRIAAERAIAARLAETTLSVEDICEAVQISRSSLYRLFGEEGGLKRYVQRQRLEQVRLALTDANNRDPIAVLARRWGFGSSPHLSRTFQTHFGINPNAYRKQAR